MNNRKLFLIVLLLFSFINLFTIFPSAAMAVCNDTDLDGYGSPASPDCLFPTDDCDDSDPNVYPGATRICDGKDSDCDGRTDFITDIDNDNDGVAWCEGDCNDNNPNMYPGNIEGPFGDATCSDGLDNDCDNKKDLIDPNCTDPCFDLDGDGYGSPGSPFCPGGTANDCDNNNPAINPGASDANCNGIDEDCTGTADDSYTITPTNCGTGACASTGQLECQSGTEVNTCTAGSPQQEGPLGDPTCSDTIDNDCDGSSDNGDANCLTACLDSDGDGYGTNGHATCTNGTAIDCNDNDPAINPGANDSNCNGIDEDCTGTADDNYVQTVTNCGTGECASNGLLECQSGSEVDTCSPGIPQTEGPNGDPTCSDGLDNDCNGTIDIADLSCDDPNFDDDGDGWTENQGDCDDTDNAVYPGAARICDGKDNDCDTRRDFVTDVDNDGDGAPLCGGDCNDNNPNMYPGNYESHTSGTCTDGIDNDCNSKTDAVDPNCIDPCMDIDGDGYGSNGDPTCPNGTAVDCDDADPSINPGAADTNCNDVDEDCSGTADDGYIPTATNCGAGFCAAAGQLECQSGSVVDSCSPGTPLSEGPLGDPTCGDAIDNDCDGDIDGGDINCSTACLDSDGDGYGSNGDPTCPNGAAVDCNDNNSAVNPGATDSNCNGIDEDCSGTADNGYINSNTNCGIGACSSTGVLMCQSGAVVNTCSPGAPQTEGPNGDPTCGDGIDNDCDGTVDISDINCDNPDVDDDSDGWTENQGDCDDTDNTVYPGAARICDGKDNDCDGRRDIVTDVDNDGDGVPWCAGDCDDNDPAEYPGNTEGPFGDPTCSDVKDNDCDNKIDLNDPNCSDPCLDTDGDGYGSPGSPFCPNGAAVDCDNTNAAINPGASDSNCNDIDEDCSGTADDGYAVTPTNCGTGACASTGQIECQSGTEVNTCAPGTPQAEGPMGDPTCSDTSDNDCDGSVDGADTNCTTACLDTDGDGWGSNGDPTCANGAAIDCNDTDPTINPGASDNNCNGIDENCSGTADDSYTVTPTNCGTGICAAAGQLECQSGTEVNTCTSGTPQTEGPNGDPTCSDGLDNDCDGNTDIADLSCDDPNVDDDGDGWTENQGDCDDTDNAVYPGAARICDGKDNDCDGRLDIVTDRDNDGDGVPLCAGDCDDNDPDEYPGNIEGPFGDPTCSDVKDNNCDNRKDALDFGCMSPCLDIDGDGYGANGDIACANGPAIDCNDNNPNINPGKTDTDCNAVDDDCSGTADDGYVVTPTNCGTGACASTGQIECQSGMEVDTCSPSAPVTEGPLGDATCSDIIDNDCDGDTDNADPNCLTACLDSDGDGYGSNGDPTCPLGTAIDCNDNDVTINPGASDSNCNDVDEDCSGTADDGYAVTPTNCGTGACASTGQIECQTGVVVDTCTVGTPQTEGPNGDPTCIDSIDNDCDGVADGSDIDCNDPNIDDDSDGWTENQGDCDDTDLNVYPGAARICDGKDSDCDGRLDIVTDIDNDSDGWAVCAGDCNDSDPSINPGQQEGPYGDPTCSDIKDNDCNGNLDAGDANCAAPSCQTKTTPKNGPHFFTLLNPDDTVHNDDPALLCGKCHDVNDFSNQVRRQCQRCHADPADTSDPFNGITKALYPLDWPYGYGSAPNVKLHSSTVLGNKYGNWDLGCVTCHNPHQQEQDMKFGTSYGMLIKEYICLDNPVTGLNTEELIEFTAPTGAGSFADGTPHNENVCEICHTQTNHHRNDGTAPGDLDGSSNYVGHYDGAKCTDCHLHSEGFKPNCGSCHDAPPPTGTHLKHFAGTKDDAAYGSTNITQDVTSQASTYLMNCGNCHPTDLASHNNGVLNSGGGSAEIVLYDPNAPAGSVKSLNPATATYTPGTTIYTDAKGLKYTQGTCSNVYCHSGPEVTTTGTIPNPTPGPTTYPLTYSPPWESFVVKTRQYQTPTWGVDSLSCNGCHGYPIQTSFPTVSAGAGDSHAWIGEYGYLNLHMWNMGFDPLQCNTCHYDTVRDTYTWTRDEFSIQLGDITIFNTANHINGAKEVVFTPVPIDYPTSWGNISHDPSTATYDSATSTCSNVPCHNYQTTVKWGNPYRWANSWECNACHQQ